MGEKERERLEEHGCSLHQGAVTTPFSTSVVIVLPLEHPQPGLCLLCLEIDKVNSCIFV